MGRFMGAKDDKNRGAGKAVTCVLLHSWGKDWSIGSSGREGMEMLREPKWFSVRHELWFNSFFSC